MLKQSKPTPPFQKLRIVSAIGLCLSLNTQITQAEQPTSLESITVKSGFNVEKRLSERGLLKDDVVQTEVISKTTLEKKQAGSLSQAIKNEPGVRVSTECSMCGVKRVMLNGLKGEHTTLMIDGVPNSSLIEGFYGFDAIPTAGLSSVEVSRGSGAALIAPEAIGGVINVITEKPQEDAIELDISQGSDNYHKYQFVGKKVSKDGNTRAIIAGQSDNIDQYDQDNNYVNEAPKLENRSIMAKVWHDISETDSVNFRITDQQSEVFGGPMLDDWVSSKTDAASTNPGDADFQGDNVGNRPTAGTTPRDFLENIKSTKQEFTGKWIHEINQDWNTQVTGSYVKAEMDAIYEGNTYVADQDIYYLDTKANYLSNEKHFITFGADYKIDKSKTDGTSWSEGGEMFFAPKKPGDGYDSKTFGVYIRDIWTPQANLEISAALRADKIDVDFVDQDNEFNETLLAPRLHIRYDHNFEWTSRFSAGLGYRVPLQFFEAEHGIIDDGFAVDVTKLEKSTSARYDLSYSGVNADFTTSFSTASIKNLATIEERSGTPTLVSTNFTSNVSHFDVSGNYNFGNHKHWAISATAEQFFYDSNYRSTFSVLPVEQRLRLGLDYSGHGWEGGLSTTWVGSRKFSDYPDAAYDEQYESKGATEQKGNGKNSPAFYTVDFKLSKQLNNNFTLYAGVNNLLDFTQTKDGSSPLFYNDADEVDVTHIWGPLRGRTIYGGLKAKF